MQNNSISRVGIITFYLLMAGVGVLWTSIEGRSPLMTEPFFRMTEYAAITLGLGFGLLVVFLSRLSERLPSMYRLNRLIQDLLGPISSGDALLIALCSSIGEELFFRGAMLPSLGLIPSSILFGILHMGPNRQFYLWPLIATVLGLALGLLYQSSGILLTPILAHFTINYFNLHHIRRLNERGQRGLLGY